MKLRVLLLSLVMMFQKASPMGSVACRAFLKNARNYQTHIGLRSYLNQMPKRTLSGSAVLVGTGSAATNPAAACCIGAGIACKIAWELYWYGYSQTWHMLIGDKRETPRTRKEIDDHYNNISNIYGYKGPNPLTLNDNPNFYGTMQPLQYINPFEKMFFEARGLSNEEARQKAKEWGFIEAKPDFYTHGELAFRKKNRWISPDNTGHRGSVWKVFDRDGEIVTCWDKDGNDIGKGN